MLMHGVRHGPDKILTESGGNCCAVCLTAPSCGPQDCTLVFCRAADRCCWAAARPPSQERSRFHWTCSSTGCAREGRTHVPVCSQVGRKESFLEGKHRNRKKKNSLTSLPPVSHCNSKNKRCVHRTWKERRRCVWVRRGPPESERWRCWTKRL